MLENGLLSAITNEQLRHYSVRAIAAGTDRARKHTSNNPHGVNTIHLSSIVFVPSSFPKNQLETRLDEAHTTVASLVDEPKRPNCSRSKSERQSIVYGRSEKNPSPCTAHQTDKAGRKEKSTRATHLTTCTYKHYIRPITHKTKDCAFAKPAAEIGAEP